MTQNRFNTAVFGIFAQPGTEHQCAGQGCPSAHRMHHGRSGKINKSQVLEPAVAVEKAAPGPAAENRIYQSAEHDTIDQVNGEFGSFRHGAGNDGGGSSAEYGLKHPKRQDPWITANLII